MDNNMTMNICNKCGLRKQVCCGFSEEAKDLRSPFTPDKDFPGPSWCLDCCPYKAEHAQDRRRSMPVAPTLTNALDLLRRLRSWDMMGLDEGDFPYWRREIDKVLNNENSSA